MLFADEVVDPARLDDIPDADDVKTYDRELAIAKQLVESLAGDFEPDKYHDTYREAVLEMIEKKAAGEEIAIQPEAEEAAPVPDLMWALKASPGRRARAHRRDADAAEPSPSASAPPRRSPRAKAKSAPRSSRRGGAAAGTSRHDAAADRPTPRLRRSTAPAPGCAACGAAAASRSSTPTASASTSPRS